METPSCPNNCPDRTRPGSLRLLAWHTGGGHWRAGAALPGGSCPDGVCNYREAAVTLRQSRSNGGGVGAAGFGASLLKAARTVLRARESTALPPRAPWTGAWGFPHPESRLPGKIPAPFPAPRSCPAERGGGDSRNLPGDRAGVTELNRPIYGQRFRNVSGESPGALG